MDNKYYSLKRRKRVIHSILFVEFLIFLPILIAIPIESWGDGSTVNLIAVHIIKIIGGLCGFAAFAIYQTQKFLTIV